MPIHDLLTRCEVFCETRRMSSARLSTLLFGSGVTIERLRGGGNVTVRVLERAEARLVRLERDRKSRALAEPQATVQ